MLSKHSSRPHPSVGDSSFPEGNNELPTAVEAKGEPEESEEAAQLAIKAAEAYLGSQDHNDIEGSQYQLVMIHKHDCYVNFNLLQTYDVCSSFCMLLM